MKRFVAGFVALPDTIKAGIAAVFVFLVAAFFNYLIVLLPFLSFIGAYASPVALALSAAFVGWLQKIIPDAYSEIAITALRLILLLLAMFGVGQVLAAKVPAFGLL